jgi:peptidase E
VLFHDCENNKKNSLPVSAGCLYVGASAGAIVAGRSIETALWKGWDDPSVAGEDFEW